jgi:creatinine amidohydrolase
VRLADLTYTEFAGLDRSKCLALLPVGAVEAHGPHLPLGTDVVIAHAMAQAAGDLLSRQGWLPLVLPALHFTVAGFGQNFPGTFNFRPETVKSWLYDLTHELARWKFRALGIANAHLDPGHLQALKAGLQEAPLPVAFPDLTRRKHAARLTEEFQSGACHAGQYEGSIVMAARPKLVKLEAARKLKDNPRSLVDAIRAGQSTFEEAGGERAYFGSPSGINEREGRETIATLGAILAEELLTLL